MIYEQCINTLCHGAQPTANQALILSRAPRVPRGIVKVSTYINNHGEQSNISFIPHDYASPHPWGPNSGECGDVSSGVAALPRRFAWVHFVVLLQEKVSDPTDLSNDEINTVVFNDWWVVNEDLSIPEREAGVEMVMNYDHFAHANIWVMRPSGLGVFLTYLCRI